MNLKALHNEKVMVLMDQAIFSGNSFVATALLARFLGIEGFGIYSTIVLGIYLTMSMSNALIIQPMQVAYSTFEGKASYFGFTLGAQIILCSSLFVIIYGISQINIPAFDVLNQVNLLFISLLVTSWLLHDYFRKTFLAKQEIKNTIVVDCIMASIQLAGIIGLGVTGNLTLDTTILLMSSAYFCSSITGFVIGDIKFRDIKFSRDYFNYHKKEGSFLFLSSLLQWWSSNLFVVASGLFLGVAALGAFRLVQSMFGVLNLLLQTYENYVLPKAAKIFASSKLESKSYLKSITSKGGLLFVVVLVPLFVFSKEAIYLFGGSDYISYHYVVRGMVILYTIIYIGYSVRMPIRMLSLNRSFFVGYGISFVFSLVSFQFLLEQFGIAGAIAGLIINQVLMISYWRTELVKNNFTVW